MSYRTMDRIGISLAVSAMCGWLPALFVGLDTQIVAHMAISAFSAAFVTAWMSGQ